MNELINQSRTAPSTSVKYLTRETRPPKVNVFLLMFVLSRSLASLHRALPPNPKGARSGVRLREVLNSFRRVKEFGKEFIKDISPATTASPRPSPRPSGQIMRFCNWNLRVICSRYKQRLAAIQGSQQTTQLCRACFRNQRFILFYQYDALSLLA